MQITHHLKRAGIWHEELEPPQHEQTSPTPSKEKFMFLLSFLQVLTKGGKNQYLSVGAQSQPGAVINREKKCRWDQRVFCPGHSSLLRTNLDSEVGGILNILFYNAGN